MKVVCFIRGLALATALVAGGIPAFAETAATNRFGFTGPEIFPIDYLIGNLRVADLDGDGLNDLVVINNAKSKINLLYNQTGKTNPVEKVSLKKGELNELPPDARFRIESIASEKRISALVVDDLNGDGRPDIAYYGDPKELIVLYRETGPAEWSAAKRWPIEDGQLSPNALCSGDLNGDGRTDLALLAEGGIQILYQQANHIFDEPVKLPVSGTVKAAQIVDVDGDGRKDLLLVNWEDRNPFRFRLQKADGQLGPEIYFPLAPVRSYWADNLEANKRTQVISIALNSGRAQVAEFQRKDAEPLSGSFKLGQFQVLPLLRTDKARRGLLWADVNGDGREDLLCAEPESGHLSVFFQQPDGGLTTARTFPTLAGITDLAVADWEGDGKPEVFMLSADERQVGIARLDEKERLPFPTLIPLQGRPLVLGVGRLHAGARPVLAVIVDNDGQRSLVLRQADGTTTTQKLDKDYKSNPVALTFHDADQDGLTDLVVLTPYEKVKVLRQVEDKPFEELDVAPPGGVVEQPWLSIADLDGDGKPELLLTQKNFVRAVLLVPDATAQTATNRSGWSFKVKEQVNGAASNSRLAGAAVLRNGTNTAPSLFLLDVEKKALTLCERDSAGVWQIVRNIPLPVAEFNGLQAVSLGGTNCNTVGFLGLNSVAWLPFGGQVWEIKELDGYETPIKDGRLNDLVSGDLDNDGRKDLVFLETAKNYLDLVIFNADHKLVPANRWQVFEERTFRGTRAPLPEPREAAVADVTGDHKNDLILVVHDRILVYPQE